jgi:hypothetical protein
VPRALFNGRYPTQRVPPVEQCPRHRASPGVTPDATQGKYCKVDPVRITRQNLPRFDPLAGEFRI